jgi:spermidine synthase
VAELLPEVVTWNRQYLGAVNGMLLDDPRVHIVMGDVYQTVAKAPPGHYDAILLDVDNGPIAMTQDGNARLYQPAGLAMIMQVLKPRCRATIWSATDDRAFPKRLGKAGFKVEVVHAKAYPQAHRAAHTIFVAERMR